VHGRNLTDKNQREHVSFVKDLAPALGRRVEAGIRSIFISGKQFLILLGLYSIAQFEVE